MKNLATLLVAGILLSGCATLDKGQDPVAINAERSLRVALITLDAALFFESNNPVPDVVTKAAAKLRATAPQALVSANRVRMAYKAGRASESALLTSLTVVEQLVSEAHWWAARNNAAASSILTPTQMIVIDATSNSTKSWVTTVPMFIDLGKTVYRLVREAKISMNQTKAWSAEEDEQFRLHMLQTVTQEHWK